jgi:hypothetical protein
VKSIFGIVLTLAVLGTWLACASGPPPAPCVNIENCGNPADLPPLTDTSPINLAGRRAPDGGAGQPKPTTGGCKDGRSWPDGSPPDEYCRGVPPAPWNKHHDGGSR